MLLAQFELQIPDELQKTIQQNPAVAAQLVDRLFWMAMAVLGFGAIAAISAVNLAREGWIVRQNVERLLAAIVIATLTCFLVVAGYSQAQYAWLMAFFGALIGHYFRESYRDQSPPPAA